MDESLAAWEKLQENPEAQKLQDQMKQHQEELDRVKVDIKTLPPAQKMEKMKQSKALQEEIDSCRRKAVLLEEAVQPRTDEALALSVEAETHLAQLKAFEEFAKEKAKEFSAETLQAIVEKETSTDELFCKLNQQFQNFIEQAQ